MRQLQDVVVEGMALVRRPANKKRFLTTKSEEADVPNDPASQVEAPPAAVSDAIDAIALSKSDSANGHELLHTASHLFQGSDLTLQDFMAFGQAMGMADIQKASDKKDKKEDGRDADDDGDGDEMDKKKNPFAKSEQAKPETAPVETIKPASASEGEGEKMPSSEGRDQVSKSEFAVLQERLAKSEAAVAGFQHKEDVRLEKSANEEAYANLEIDHDALADVTLALKKSSRDHMATLTRVLKSADEQVRVAKASGGSPFRPRSVRGGIAKGEEQGMSDWKSLVKKHMEANKGVSENDAITAVAKSAEGLAAYRAAKGNI